MSLIKNFKTILGGIVGIVGLLTVLVILMGFFVLLKGTSELFEGEKGYHQEHLLEVSSTVERNVVPDIAKVYVWVVTESETTKESLSENAQKMNEVIKFLKGEGIKKNDIKTVSFNIFPRYEWRKNGERVFRGYQTTQKLLVKIRDFEKIGAILDGVVAQGANRISDLSFDIDNKEEVVSQARKEAIEKAKQKAKTLARQLDIKLGKIVKFQESKQTPTPPPIYRGFDIMTESSSKEPNIAPGVNTVRVTVTLGYQIK